MDNLQRFGFEDFEIFRVEFTEASMTYRTASKALGDSQIRSDFLDSLDLGSIEVESDSPFKGGSLLDYPTSSGEFQDRDSYEHRGYGEQDNRENYDIHDYDDHNDHDDHDDYDDYYDYDSYDDRDDYDDYYDGGDY